MILLEQLERILVDLVQHVGVDLHGDGRVGVINPLAQDLDEDAGIEQVSDVRMPQIVDAGCAAA